jgi:hypothetical protein
MTGRPQPARIMRKMSDVEAAWLSGFIDGEGHVERRMVQVTSAEIEYISACLRVSGLGSVSLQRAPGEGLAKHYNWVWYVYGILTVKALMERLSPFCMKSRVV